MGDFEDAELDRRSSNSIRIGKIAEVDYGAARVKVAIDEILTDWLPWVTQRAGGDVSWWAPEIGEQVLLLSPSDEMEDAVVLGSIYQDAFPHPQNTADISEIVYKDGTTLTYDRSSNILTVDAVGQVVVNAKTVTINAEQVIINAPDTIINGHLKVSNGISSDKGGRGIVSVGSIVSLEDVRAYDSVSLGQHTHGGVEPGGGSTAKPNQ